MAIRLIKKGIVYTIIVFIIILALNQLYVNNILSEKLIYRTNIDYNNYKGNLTVLIMGDSHPALGINPSKINNSFNYTVQSESYDQTYFKFRKATKENPNLEYVLLPLEPYSFSDYRANKYVYTWYWLNYLTYKELSKITGKSKLNLYISKTFPILGNGQELSRLYGKPDLTELYKGWNIKDADWALEKNKNRITSDRIKIQFKENYEINPKLLYYFLEIIKLANENNIIIVIVKYPLSNTYLEELNKTNFNNDKYNNTLFYFINKNNNTIILDYQKSFKNDSHFSNQDHLNRIGATRLSEKINSVLINNSLMVK